MKLYRDAVEARSNLAPEHLGTLVRLAVEADWRAGEVRGSVRALAQHFGYALATFQRHLDALKQAEEIEVEPGRVRVLAYGEMTGVTHERVTGDPSAGQSDPSAGHSPGETEGEEGRRSTTETVNPKPGSEERAGPTSLSPPGFEFWADTPADTRRVVRSVIAACLAAGFDHDTVRHVARRLSQDFDPDHPNQSKEFWLEACREFEHEEAWDYAWNQVEELAGPEVASRLTFGEDVPDGDPREVTEEWVLRRLREPGALNVYANWWARKQGCLRCGEECSTRWPQRALCHDHYFSIGGEEAERAGQVMAERVEVARQAIQAGRWPDEGEEPDREAGREAERAGRFVPDGEEVDGGRADRASATVGEVRESVREGGGSG